MPVRLFLGWALLASIHVVGIAQDNVPASWQVGPTHATAKPSSIGVPLKAATLTNYALTDRNDDATDVAAQYESPDGKIRGTIFLYAPTRPDPALAFIATDDAIMRRFGPTARKVSDEIVAVGGVASAGRRAVYTGITDPKLSGDPDGRIYSAAAFVRAGEWLMKLRVSGPLSRSAEIDRAMDALLVGLVFEKTRLPLRQTVITTSECAATAERPSVTLQPMPLGEAVMVNMMLDPDIVDKDGNAIDNPIMPAISAMCRQTIEVKDDIALQIFKVTVAGDGPYAPRLVMLYGDAGIMLLAFESKHHPGEYYFSRHGIGRTFLFGRATGLPSRAELVAVLRNPEPQPAVITVKRMPLGDKNDVSIDCSKVDGTCGDDKVPTPKT